MNPETRTCQNCKQNFTIEPEDFNFYEKIKVPPPTWCPECRLMRRFSFTNVWELYKNSCAKCGQKVISIYSPDKPNTVYCMKCWWADDWDGTEYALDYDPSRPFLSQVKELIAKTPWQALEVAYLTLTNSEYINASGHIKNSYLIFWADYCENAFYSSYLNGLKDSLDCYRMVNSELCYEDTGCNKCFRTFFSEECSACTDVWFSRSLTGCTNCFGCINLRNKNYWIFNEQYSKEDYFKKLTEFNLESRRNLNQLINKVEDFWAKHPRRFYEGNSLNVNVSGDYVYESKNTKNAYLVTSAEDSKFIQINSLPTTKDCYDYTGWGNNAEKIYESAVVGEGVSNIKFSDECWPDAINIEYSIYATACKNVFGCVNLKRKNHCILNKEYPKEEYEKLITQIREDMKKNPYRDASGKSYPYGEFFSMEFSPFCYNETLAQRFFPKTKEEILEKKLTWHDKEENQYNITIKGADLPGAIKETRDSIVNEVIGCENCGKAFKITPIELNLMRRLCFPLPEKCPNCRQERRFKRTNPPKLYNRTCQKCEKEIETSYAPDRPEIVYCESCYNSEIA